MMSPGSLPPFLESSFRPAYFPHPVCRLGLATRGTSALSPEDIERALARGINFLNWPGTPDSLSQIIAGLGGRRQDVLVCVQFESRSADEARMELARILDQLRTDYVDILTFYYVEEPAEWEQILSTGGAWGFCESARRNGQVRLLGVTSHQRPLATTMARSARLDLVMIRYNAAHRGAEEEIFPVTQALGMPVIAYTCLRWGALLRSTADDPPGFVPPPAPDWYRFTLQNPAVSVALMAPESRSELDEDLQVLDALGPLAPEHFQRLAEHGRRVHKWAGAFP
jgi:predicted aldo/keto reductase-like oxidoreductase